MKAILVKYHGPTDTKGSRYSASDSDGNQVYVEVDDALSMADSQERAVHALCEKMAWTGTLIAGSLGKDTVYVWTRWPGGREADSITV